jgi:hypothetical protein
MAAALLTMAANSCFCAFWNQRMLFSLCIRNFIVIGVYLLVFELFIDYQDVGGGSGYAGNWW